MRIRSFQGLVPAPGREKDVAAVPYDVVNREESAALASGNPASLLHVDRAEIDLPDTVGAYDDAVYAKARDNFQSMQDAGILVRENGPCLYLYRQTMGGHAQTGIVAVCHVDDYRDDIIRKHEKTRKVKEDDRTRLVDMLGANTGPIFLTYRGVPEVDALVDAALKSTPVCDFVADDGVGHALWRIEGGDALVEAFQAVPLSYVADGHHRSASAYRVAEERRAANPAHTGDEDYNWFLCVLFPGAQLKILPYNRVVADLNGLTKETFIEKILSSGFDVAECDCSKPSSPGEVRMYLDGKWFAVSWKADPHADPVGALDVSVLQDRLLGPILGIDDPRTSERVDFIGGIRGTVELEKRVDSGRDAVAFSMYPVTVEQLMAIADAGQIMAPKSTWFEPKLRSGLFIHTF
jgi:uncharacterized protein (DUF1015 family)